ncbi:MAG: hypothetical protein GY790_23925 [Bacteroidetes bacterium]|nr:hypothetical protein [Bacteroidota bacterium]
MKKALLKTAFLMAVIFLTPGASAQDIITISGTVTTFGKIPLNQVEITVSKSDLHTYSDTLGYFSITCPKKSTLIFSANGFDGERLKVKKSEEHNIDLVYSNYDASFTKATNNNHISEGLLSMAIEKYPMKGEKDYGNYESIYQIIQNEIYFVKVNGTSVTTTKPNSFSQSQQVLYVVDGTITSDISFVLPMNVKTIKYVEGAQAGIYGSQAANGAIVITLR